jgi:hypothetical protein
MLTAHFSRQFRATYAETRGAISNMTHRGGSPAIGSYT